MLEKKKKKKKKKKKMEEEQDIRTPPNFDNEEVIKIFEDNFGLKVSKVTSLVSYEDQNFKVIADGKNYILKIQHKEQNEGFFSFFFFLFFFFF